MSFAIAGGFLFWLLAPHVPWGRETIELDARTVASVVEGRANLLGRELSDEERERAIEDYVREEILVREAYRNGWHLENSRVRQRLVLAMRPALSEDLPEPSAAQLDAYYRANADRYRVPESMTISHVFFAGDVPDDVLASLESGADFREIGDPFWLGATMVRQSEHQLRGALGPAFAEAVFALDAGSWRGPVASNRGSHFVRVDERYPPELPELESMKRFVRVDWETERRSEIRERKMTRMRERYTIIEP